MFPQRACCGVSLIKISRAHASLTLADLRRLADEFEDAAQNLDTAVIVMAGPPGTFCAGGDIGDFLDCGDLDELERIVKRFFHALIEADKPLVAAVDGAAVGLGMTMLLHFDAVFATPESTFIAPFSDLGLTPEAGSTMLAPARFGYLRAFDLLCIGRRLSAEQAREIGLVTEVTGSGEALERSLLVASRLARKPKEALTTTRRLLRGDRGDVAARIEIEMAEFRAQLEDASTARRLARIARSSTRRFAAA